LAVVQAKPPLRLLELCGGVGVIGLSLAHAVAEATKVTLLSTVPWHQRGRWSSLTLCSGLLWKWSDRFTVAPVLDGKLMLIVISTYLAMSLSHSEWHRHCIERVAKGFKSGKWRAVQSQCCRDRPRVAWRELSLAGSNYVWVPAHYYSRLLNREETVRLFQCVTWFDVFLIYNSHQDILSGSKLFLRPQAFSCNFKIF
jgi:hypothetical protein